MEEEIDFAGESATIDRKTQISMQTTKNQGVRFFKNNLFNRKKTP